MKTQERRLAVPQDRSGGELAADRDAPAPTPGGQEQETQDAQDGGGWSRQDPFRRGTERSGSRFRGAWRDRRAAAVPKG